ncbi:alpha/beta hydrolase [Pectobacterium actinidiae]|uniref:alpha/beta fold hydrolase n=1 Tax=Pectobacterium actinidiae TaxID=1507808 RepID=UPI002A8189B8|nr:alpha/beta hydrolase [Pectobacterium actinidiae]MDY4314807.1 alpha/beta hydrolase [Pectobacterium actinidiae]
MYHKKQSHTYIKQNNPIPSLSPPRDYNNYIQVRYFQKKSSKEMIIMLYTKIGSGRPVIFLPGLFAGGWIWNAVVKKVIDADYSAIVINEPIPVTFSGSYKKANDILQEVVEACDEAPYLVGNSLGSLIALHYTSLNQSRIKGLVMSGAPGQIEADSGVSLSELRTGNKKYALALLDKIFFDKTKIPQNGIDEISYLFSNDQVHKNIVRWLSFSRKYDVPTVLNKITIPVNLIWGEHDMLTPVEPWISLSQIQRHVTMSIIKNCGHSPMLEKPNVFLEELLFHLNSKVLSES